MYNENEKLAVKQTLSTAGWILVEEMLRDELIDGKKITSFNTEGKSNEAIAREVVAREIAGKTIEKLFAKLNRIKNEEHQKKVIYK